MKWTQKRFDNPRLARLHDILKRLRNSWAFHVVFHLSLMVGLGRLVLMGDWERLPTF